MNKYNSLNILPMLIFLALMIFGATVASQSAYAFSCQTDGIYINTGQITTIPVDISLPTSLDDTVTITDMSLTTTCDGSLQIRGQEDALRTTSATISNELTAQGYSGYINTPEGLYNEPLSTNVCVWPANADENCEINPTPGYITLPLNIQISIKHTSNIGDGVTIPAGTEIARLDLEQRSYNSWGWNKTWSFVLKHDLVIPAHTCKIDASTPSRVDLPPIPGSSLSHKGSTAQDTPFTIELKCNSNIGVSLFLDGAEDIDAAGNGVLAINTGPDKATGVGIQLLNNDLPIEFQKDIYVGTTSTEGFFKIPMTARYYKTTSLPVKAGDVSASITYSLTYQ